MWSLKRDWDLFKSCYFPPGCLGPVLNCCEQFPIQRLGFHVLKLREHLPSCCDNSQLPTSPKVSNYNEMYDRARSRQRHAPLSPARRRLRPRGPHSSPRGRPHAGPGARAAALLAAGPRAMPPGGRPTRDAAHGRVPTRPGEPRRPCRRPGPGGSGETPAPRRSSSSGPRAGCNWRPGRT